MPTQLKNSTPLPGCIEIREQLLWHILRHLQLALIREGQASGGMMGCHAPRPRENARYSMECFTASKGKLHLADLTHETDLTAWWLSNDEMVSIVEEVIQEYM